MNPRNTSDSKSSEPTDSSSFSGMLNEENKKEDTVKKEAVKESSPNLIVMEGLTVKESFPAGEPIKEEVAKEEAPKEEPTKAKKEKKPVLDTKFVPSLLDENKKFSENKWLASIVYKDNGKVPFLVVEGVSPTDGHKFQFAYIAKQVFGKEKFKTKPADRMDYENSYYITYELNRKEAEKLVSAFDEDVSRDRELGEDDLLKFLKSNSAFQSANVTFNSMKQQQTILNKDAYRRIYDNLSNVLNRREDQENKVKVPKNLEIFKIRAAKLTPELKVSPKA